MKDKRLEIRLTTRLYERLRQEAAAREWPMAAVVRAALDAHLPGGQAGGRAPGGFEDHASGGRA